MITSNTSILQSFPFIGPFPVYGISTDSDACLEIVLCLCPHTHSHTHPVFYKSVPFSWSVPWNQTLVIVVNQDNDLIMLLHWLKNSESFLSLNSFTLILTATSSLLFTGPYLHLHPHTKMQSYHASLSKYTWPTCLRNCSHWHAFNTYFPFGSSPYEIIWDILKKNWLSLVLCFLVYYNIVLD